MTTRIILKDNENLILDIIEVEKMYSKWGRSPKVVQEIISKLEISGGMIEIHPILETNQSLKSRLIEIMKSSPGIYGKIKAIKVHRKQTGSLLKASKEYCEELQRMIHDKD